MTKFPTRPILHAGMKPISSEHSKISQQMMAQQIQYNFFTGVLYYCLFSDAWVNHAPSLISVVHDLGTPRPQIKSNIFIISDLQDESCIHQQTQKIV